MQEIEYTKLRLDVLQKLIDEREIICKNKKDEMIKYLIMDDQGKYIRETTYEKHEKNKHLVGIDIRNTKQLIEMGKLIEKKESRIYGLYTSNRVYFISNQKLM